jgi:murein DD-endopeptidase MepM/ murein hydrolase activator NlpD
VSQRRHPRIKTIRTDRRPDEGGFTCGVRDTGLYVRRPAPGAAHRRSALPVIVLIASALLVALVAAAFTSRGDDGRASTATTAPAATTAALEASATPAFATCEGIELHLPVAADALTALAFHQASGKKSLHMTSLVPDADMERAAELKAVPPTDASATSATGLATSCLRLWRSNRSGEPDTAADVGADPGTPVLAPVSGTILEIKPYKLYDKYDDYEIHIQPEGYPLIDVVLIHVDAPSIAVGQRVTAGVTQIAVVRKMSDKIDIQLGGYTTNGGDHVHLQVNTVEVPGVLEQPDGS